MGVAWVENRSSWSGNQESLTAVVASLVSDIYKADQLAALDRAVRVASSALGFDGYMLSVHKPLGPEVMLDADLHSFPQHFLNDYERLGWYRDDFVTQRMFRATKPFSYSGRQASSLTPGHSNFKEFLHAHQMSQSVVIPLEVDGQFASAMSLVTSSNTHINDETLYACQIIAVATAASFRLNGASRSISADEAQFRYGLSPQQLDIVGLIAAGKSNGEIALITGLRERTVKYHVAETLKKLGVTSRTQAIAKLCKVS